MDVKNVLVANYLFVVVGAAAILFYVVLKLENYFHRFSLAAAYTFIFNQKTQFIFIIFNFQLNADNAAVYDTVIFAGSQNTGPMKQVKCETRIMLLCQSSECHTISIPSYTTASLATTLRSGYMGQ